jgi:hypothetical protein
MRIQSRHADADRGADPYFSPPDATATLLQIEREFLPGRIWEPAAGDGAIARPLQSAGFYSHLVGPSWITVGTGASLASTI